MWKCHKRLYAYFCIQILFAELLCGCCASLLVAHGALQNTNASRAHIQQIESKKSRLHAHFTQHYISPARRQLWVGVASRSMIRRSPAYFSLYTREQANTHTFSSPCIVLARMRLQNSICARQLARKHFFYFFLFNYS